MNIGNNVEQALQVSATGLRNRAPTNSTDGKELGKQDFLNLLMTQMANQDPLDPMDSAGMMQQLAAMGTVEQLQNLNNQTAKLMAIQLQIARATAGSLLDKDVEVGANFDNFMGNLIKGRGKIEGQKVALIISVNYRFMLIRS